MEKWVNEWTDGMTDGRMKEIDDIMNSWIN